VNTSADKIEPVMFHTGARPDEQSGFSARTLFSVLASGALYYLATQTAWFLCFPDS